MVGIPHSVFRGFTNKNPIHQGGLDIFHNLMAMKKPRNHDEDARKKNGDYNSFGSIANSRPVMKSPLPPAS
jgi:hypothetical protein